jgi:ubiquinone/menaquinone biosynthesis C-methylase UbiE
MTILYSKLARVYHEIYSSIFDYDQEFKIYHQYLQESNAKKILELGCGCGDLGYRLFEQKYDYLGVDLNSEMLKISKEMHPNLHVIQGDMRTFVIADKFDAILIPGRSFSYMTTNKDVFQCLAQVHRHLKPNGILIFDNFLASAIFGNFKPEIVVETTFQSRKYKRVSKNSPNLQTGWTWNWNAKYFVEEDGQKTEYDDNSILRAFTEEELKLDLHLCGFTVQSQDKLDFSVWFVAQKEKPVYDVIKYKFLA